MTSYTLNVHLNAEVEIETSYLEKSGSNTLSIDSLTLFIGGSPTQRLYIAQQLRKACDEIADQARAAAVERHAGPEYLTAAERDLLDLGPQGG